MKKMMGAKLEESCIYKMADESRIIILNVADLTPIIFEGLTRSFI